MTISKLTLKSYIVCDITIFILHSLTTMSGLAINPKGVQFNPDSDIPDLTGKIILVTGGVFTSSAR